ncbi:MAG: GNAT family N-acetyltransferase [Lachnospiraceae bacterium]|nr:GNAT family N-acetyltransferase [Lachnospiraceae bacterium]
MTGTLINESNSDLFLPAVPSEELITSDLFIGVTDEETDTACGVLAAAAIGDHTLAIRYIWVAEEYRGRGAGTELVLTFMEAAEIMDAASAVCVHSRGNVSDGVAETLEKCGFVRDDEQTSPIYAVSISELGEGVKGAGDKAPAGIRICPLSKIDDKQWQVSGLNWRSSDGPAAGLKAFGRRRGSYDTELSFVALDKQEDISGLLLGIRKGSEYELQTLSAMGEQTPRILLALIAHALGKAAHVLGNEGRIIVSPVTSTSMKLFDQITGGAYIMVGETVLYTYTI